MNNNQASLQKLEKMKVYGMARAYTNTMETGVKNQFTADELVSPLVDAEWEDRHNRKLTRALKSTRLPYRAVFEEIDFAVDRNLDKNQLLGLYKRILP
jgi:DNA replication protein DnaC